MNDQTRNNLITIIREKTPDDINLTTYLSDLLNIGKESAYRRIRGEINFTFEEVATLSLNLGFSVDNIIGLKKDENALFNIHMLKNLGYLDIYVNKMLEYGRMFREMSSQGNSKARILANTLPYFFHISYKSLSKFRIYKWLYQNQKIKSNDKFTDFILPDKVLEAHRKFYSDIQNVPNVTVIMDDNIIWSTAKDIEYFFKRGLLSKEDILSLKKELLDLVDEIEQMAANGKCKAGNKIELYVSLVDMEASYLHVESGENQFSQVRIFSISAIDSFDIELCKIQKEWIESQKRYSVLISESGEIQRFEYLNKQREYIDRFLCIK